MTEVEIAEAFSGHRFAEAYPFLADDVHWDLVGASPLHGADAVKAACESTLDGLSDVTTTFRRFRTIAQGDLVVVESEAEYREAGGAVRVASCDLYVFAESRIVAITSYTAELETRRQSTARP